MANLKYKTRGNNSPQGKPRVYFCCHPEDFNRCFASISDEILSKQNCAIWYMDEAVVYDDNFFTDLKQMQLFVMPVTSHLLCTENKTLDSEFKFAVENHIPVLPLMQESGLEELFNKKCGDLQFLDKNNTDVTAISYDEKLKKYLESVLIGDELAEKIRAAFDAYVFLSYRKKDRRYAQELMRLIHKNEFCRDIAIWYDEFLTPGENFNTSIKEAIQKSGLFVLTVTPNLVNEPNYIMTTEYPMAKQEGKPILPAELVPTDREQLSEKYEDIPNPADAHNEAELSEALLESIKKMAIKENDNSPEHNFFIGLEYLGGIDVEVDYERAVSLITSAAESGLIEASDKLYNMYLNGNGVERNYNIAAVWLRKKVDLLKSKLSAEESPEAYSELISDLIFLAQHYARIVGSCTEAKNTYLELNKVCKEAHQRYGTLFFKRKLGTSYIYVAQAYIDAKEYDFAEEKVNKAFELLKTIKDEYLNEIYNNFQTATVEQLIDYYMSSNDLATLYEGLAEVALNKEEYEKEEKFLLRCLELRLEVAKHIKENALVRLNVAISYLALAEYYKLQGDLSEAVAYYDKGYPLASEIGAATGYLYAGEISVRFNMLRAEIHLQQNEKEEAVLCCRTNLLNLEASKLSPQMMALKADNYYLASKLCYSTGDFKHASLFFTKYLQIYSRIFDKKKCEGIFSEMLEMGDTYLRGGDYDGAKRLYKATIKFSKFLNFGDEDAKETYFATKVLAYKRIAVMYVKLNKRSKAKKYFSITVKTAEAALKYRRSAETYRQIFETYGTMGDWYKTDNRFKAAAKCYSNAICLAEKSVFVFQKEKDKFFLASTYLVVGTMPGKNSSVMLEKYRELWQELLQINPSSEMYKNGNDMVISALKKL